MLHLHRAARSCAVCVMRRRLWRVTMAAALTPATAGSGRRLWSCSGSVDVAPNRHPWHDALVACGHRQCTSSAWHQLPQQWQAHTCGGSRSGTACRALHTATPAASQQKASPPRRWELSLERTVGDSLGVDSAVRSAHAFTAEVFPDLPIATTWENLWKVLFRQGPAGVHPVARTCRTRSRDTHDARWGRAAPQRRRAVPRHMRCVPQLGRCIGRPAEQGAAARR